MLLLVVTLRCHVVGYQRSLHHEDGGSMVLRNVGILPRHAVSQRRISLREVCKVEPALKFKIYI
jgi:hypothetical protein